MTFCDSAEKKLQCDISLKMANIVNTLVTTVKQDVEQSTKGKQWLYSCYSPAKDCISIPGIEDITPEEMRFDAYNAKSDASQTQQYQQKYQQLNQV